MVLRHIQGADSVFVCFRLSTVGISGNLSNHQLRVLFICFASLFAVRLEVLARQVMCKQVLLGDSGEGLLLQDCQVCTKRKTTVVSFFLPA